ncbi:hypothetical protein [Sphingosinithalassobacter sp. LHW66-3]|uniref:hypothetical protein n=1 Tax=Sphingosinithalassobacter sp. LHW66-3 TaxID=3424718 RepID=UPI003D6C29CD
MMRIVALATAAALLAGCEAQSPSQPEPMPSGTATDPASAPAGPPTPEPTPSVAAATDTRHGPIPMGYRGVWSAGEGGCARGAEQRLRIEPDTLVFYESAATPGRVEQLSDSSIRLDLAFTGEGETWTQTNTLTLLDDGRRLRREQAEMPPVTYTRCEE